MAKIPFQPRRRSIPGAVRQPRATAEDFGGGIGDVAQDVGLEISDYAQDYLDKKFKDEADVFVSKTQSETRAWATRRAIELRKTIHGDISQQLDQEFETRRTTTLGTSPNGDATRRAGIALNHIKGTMRSNAIIGDEAARDKRVEFQSGQSHRDNLTTVYDDFGSLNTVIVQEANQINTLRLNPQTKKELIVSRRKELGLQALTGLVDRNKAGAEQVLRILNDPTHSELQTLMKHSSVSIEDLLDVKQRQKMEKYAEKTIKSHDAEVRLKMIDDERIRAKGQRKIKNDLFAKFEDGMLTNELIKNSGGDSETRSVMRNNLILRAQGREDPGPPPAERAEAYEDLADTIDVTDPEDIADIDDAIDWHVANRLITPAQGNMLSERLNEPINKTRSEMEKRLRKRITGANQVTGDKDPIGDILFERAQFEIRDAVRDAKENDVPLYRLFDPRTDEGKELRDRLAPLARTFGQILNDMARASGSLASTGKSDDEIAAEIIKALK